MKLASDDDIEKASNVVKDELKKIIDSHCEGKDEILVVGLGNQFVTPDSLGPKVVSEIDITKHFLKYTPRYVEPGTHSVCAIAPGVLGTTGIETYEIIKGIVDNVKSKMLIVIDSLASKRYEYSLIAILMLELVTRIQKFQMLQSIINTIKYSVPIVK